MNCNVVWNSIYVYLMCELAETTYKGRLVSFLDGNLGFE